MTTAPYIGDLTGCRLWHNNRMPSGAWHCEWVFVHEIYPTDENPSPGRWYFPCNQWLRGDGRSPLRPLDLLPLDVTIAPPLAIQEPEIHLPEDDDNVIEVIKSQQTIEEPVEYVIEVETSNAIDAGTQHIGWIIVKGRNGISPVLKLIDPHGRPVLQAGSIDKFK